MSDITNPRLLWLKALLFLLCGGIASAMLLLESPAWRTGCLLGMAVWCFCRAYYFAFYVIEKYVDPTFRYAGLIAMVRDVVRMWREQRES